MIPGIIAGQMQPATVAASSYSELLLSHGPLGYWRLGETSGTTAADSSGNGRSGTYTGTYTLNRPSLIPSDTSNGALGCGAGTGYVNVPAAAAIPLAGKTLVFAVKLSSLATISYPCHVGNYLNSSERGVSVIIWTGGQLELEFFDGDFRYVQFSGFTVTVGVTYRIAVRFNSNQSATLFVNGALVATGTTPYNLDVTPGKEIRIGAARNIETPLPSQGVLKGDIDEFAILPSLLSEAQISALEAAALS